MSQDKEKVEILRIEDRDGQVLELPIGTYQYEERVHDHGLDTKYQEFNFEIEIVFGDVSLLEEE